MDNSFLISYYFNGWGYFFIVLFKTKYLSMLCLPNKQNHVKITSISRYRLEESYVLQTPDIYVNVLIRLLY